MRCRFGMRVNSPVNNVQTALYSHLDFCEAFESETAKSADAEMGQFEVEGVVRVIGEEVLVLRNLFSGNDLVCLRLSGRYDCAFRLFASSERRAHDDGGSALVAALVVLEAALVELQIRELVPASAVRDVSAVRLAPVLAVVAACVGSPRRLGLGGHRHRRGQSNPRLFRSVCHSVWCRLGAVESRASCFQ